MGVNGNGWSGMKRMAEEVASYVGDERILIVPVKGGGWIKFPPFERALREAEVRFEVFPIDQSDSRKLEYAGSDIGYRRILTPRDQLAEFIADKGPFRTIGAYDDDIHKGQAATGVLLYLTDPLLAGYLGEVQDVFLAVEKDHFELSSEPEKIVGGANFSANPVLERRGPLAILERVAPDKVAELGEYIQIISDYKPDDLGGLLKKRVLPTIREADAAVIYQLGDGRPGEKPFNMAAFLARTMPVKTEYTVRGVTIDGNGNVIGLAGKRARKEARKARIFFDLEYSEKRVASLGKELRARGYSSGPVFYVSERPPRVRRYSI